MGSPVPYGAFQAGNEATGQPLYVARGYDSGSLVVGKCGPHLDGVKIPYGGLEKTINFPCEVFCGTGTWKAASSYSIPANPIVAGNENDGSPLYIARAYFAGSYQPGKYSVKNKTCYIPYGGAEHSKSSSFEILTRY
jgi:hypothetical protein